MDPYHTDTARHTCYTSLSLFPSPLIHKFRYYFYSFPYDSCAVCAFIPRPTSTPVRSL